MKTNHPRLFDEVMDAIATFRDSKGTPAKRVIEKVERDINRKNSIKNPAVQIQRALKFGVDKGLITEHGGNFKLGLNTKEYKLFKDFKRIPAAGRYMEHRRRGGRRRSKRRRRRRRRRSRGSSLEEDGDSEVSDSQSESNVPEDRGRRRRRRRRSRRRGRKHAEKSGSNESIKSDKFNEISPKSSRESNKSENNPKNVDKKNEGDPDTHTNQFPEPTQNHAFCGSRGGFRNRDEFGRCNNNCQDNCNCRRIN